MGPDEDDDFEEREPLPDPSLRAWRHPSELAAVAGMAAGAVPDPPRRRRLAFGSLLLGTALGAVVVLGVAASMGLVGGEPADRRFDLRDAEATAPSTGPDRGAGADPADSAAEAGGPVTGSTDGPTGPSTSTTPTTEPSTTTSGGAGTTVATTVPAGAPLTALGGVGGELQAAEVTVRPEAVIGVAVGAAELDRPRCTGLVVEGMVVTSATAIGKASEVTLVVAGSTYPATVVARDRFTDIAIIEPPVDMPLVELAPAGPVGPDGPVALVATDGRPEPITVVGRVTGWQQAGEASDGHDLIGLVSTTARLPEPGAGSLLLTTDGALVGMVVDTPSHLAMAVPEPTVRAVIRSLLDTGHPAPVWLGLSVAASGGAVTVKRVIPAGPAAQAGLQAGDVVQALDGVAIADLGTFFSTVRAGDIGQSLALTVDRGGEVLVVEVVLGPPPPQLPTPGEQAAN